MQLKPRKATPLAEELLLINNVEGKGYAGFLDFFLSFWKWATLGGNPWLGRGKPLFHNTNLNTILAELYKLKTHIHVVNSKIN